GLRSLIYNPHFMRFKSLLKTSTGERAQKKQDLASALKKGEKSLLDMLNKTASLVAKNIQNEFVAQLIYDEKDFLEEIPSSRFQFLLLDAQKQEKESEEQEPEETVDLNDLINKNINESTTIADLKIFFSGVAKKIKSAPEFKKAIGLIVKELEKPDVLLLDNDGNISLDKMIAHLGSHVILEKEVIETLKKVGESVVKELRLIALIRSLYTTYTKRTRTVGRPVYQDAPFYEELKKIYRSQEEGAVKKLIDSGTDIYRTSRLMYANFRELIYSKQIGAIGALGITVQQFLAMFAPYGLLMQLVKAAVETKNNKNFKNSLIALNSGILKEKEEDYLPPLIENKDSVVQDKLYVGKLSALLASMEANDAASFLVLLDQFLIEPSISDYSGAKGTITPGARLGIRLEDTSEYKELKKRLEVMLSKQALFVIASSLLTLNKGTNSAIPGLETTTDKVQSRELRIKHARILMALKKKFTLLSDLIEPMTSDKQITRQIFTDTYQKILESDVIKQALREALGTESSDQEVDAIIQKLKAYFEDMASKIEQFQRVS
ncbi:MAG: hypothetical protein WBQ73_02445, partial [Candidatus Babeliales bacterium]